MMSVRRLMDAARAKRIKGPQMQKFLEENREALGGAVNQEDFVKAVGKVGRSVGEGDLLKYEQWMEEFGSA